jgi:hypothetical protein
MSRSNALEKFNARIDQKARREFFATRWRDFLHSNYQRPEQIPEIFGVTFQTAWLWWHGHVVPGG